MHNTKRILSALFATLAVTCSGAAQSFTLDQSAMARAHRLMCAQDFETAKEIAAAVVAKDPNNFAARQYLGICLYKEGMVYDALKQLNMRVATNRGNAIDHLYIGHSLFSLGDLNGAINAYTSALQLDSKLADAYTGLARCYVSSGNLKYAKAVRERASQYGCHVDLESGSGTTSDSNKNIGS